MALGEVPAAIVEETPLSADGRDSFRLHRWERPHVVPRQSPWKKPHLALTGGSP
jgi:hypothetical protein